MPSLQWDQHSAGKHSLCHLHAGAQADTAILNEDFASDIVMEYDASLYGPYLRASVDDGLAEERSLRCDVTYTINATTQRSSASCDVTVALTTNRTVLIRAQAYLPPDYVLLTKELMVQFGTYDTRKSTQRG